jgi:hypothetical protein
MNFRSCVRPKCSFRPQVERSEARFLLSAGGLVHADAVRSHAADVEVKDRYAYNIPRGQPIVQNTPIFSSYVTNDTGDKLTITLTTPTPGDKSKTNTNVVNGSSFTSNEDILLFTNRKNDWKFSLELRVPGKDIKGSFALKPENGKTTTVNAGFKFAPEEGWFNADLALSMQYKVQIEGTGTDKRLVLAPAL